MSILASWHLYLAEYSLTEPWEWLKTLRPVGKWHFCLDFLKGRLGQCLGNASVKHHKDTLTCGDLLLISNPVTTRWTVYYQKEKRICVYAWTCIPLLWDKITNTYCITNLDTCRFFHRVRLLQHRTTIFLWIENTNKIWLVCTSSSFHSYDLECKMPL